MFVINTCFDRHVAGSIFKQLAIKYRRRITKTAYFSEWCRYLHRYLDMNVTEFNMKADIHPEFKVNWAQNGPFSVQASLCYICFYFH